MTRADIDDCEGQVAVIGMAARLPGAANVDEFWGNLCGGVESIQEIERAEGDGRRGALEEMAHHVRVRACAPDIEMFDAAFFGYSPQDAALIDPQQRIFLEASWEAIEAAGYDPESFGGRVGVFGASALNMYLLRNILARSDLADSVSLFQVLFGNDKDFLSTRVSYKLNLKGPSINVQTACSSSLVAIQLACQSLNVYQCDMAVAGGAALHDPLQEGYLHQTDGILSPDGHCRAFDADGRGTVMSSGAGVVVLKRLKDALEQRDRIHAVIRGCAVNNDGARKVGYAAPGAEGQAEVIIEAHALAGIDPDSIGYVEAHGTGTHLGDPIEVAALQQAFRQGTSKTGFCALGSVKTNVGHLDTAAGVAGLIKAVLAVREGKIPPTLHFRAPNPQIDFAKSPFFVNADLRNWTQGSVPRRAAVSSFGIGGTNAHVVLEEPPRPAPTSPGRSVKLLVLSAKTEVALSQMAERLRAYLEHNPNIDLDDVAYTLQVGRKHFPFRRAILCREIDDAIAALGREGTAPGEMGVASEESSRVAFFLPGDPPHLRSFREWYASEPTFRQELDACVALLARRWGKDLRDPDVLFSDRAAAAFAVGYALGKVFIEWGLDPAIAWGRGVGALAASCLTGALSLERAVDALVDARGVPLAGESADAIPIALPTTVGLVLVMGSCEPAGPDASRSLADLPAAVERWVLLEPESTAPASALRALSSAWLRGAAPRWDRLYRHESRNRITLPTYPFQRQRHWIDPPIATGEPAVRKAAKPPSLVEDRRERTERIVRAILAESLRVEAARIDMTKSFFELDLDSLSLMQISAQIGRRLNCNITFRQIADEYSTPESLLAYLLGQPATEVVAASSDSSPAEVAPVDDGGRARATNPSLEAKLEELARQIQTLRSEITHRPTPPDPKPAPPPTGARAKPFERLTPEQERHVRQVGERVLSRTAKSRQAAQAARSRLADVRNSHRFRASWKRLISPLLIARAKGSKVWDLDGNEYVDMAMGYGTNLFGHSPEFLTRAIEDAVRAESWVIGANSELVGKTAQLFTDLTGTERVTFCNTGSEAVMTAIRLARAKTGRNKIAVFEGSFHGNFDGVLIKRAEGGRAVPATLGMPASLAEDAFVLEYGTDEALEWFRARGSELAAVLVEPIQSRNLRLQPAEFLKELRRITQETGTVLIFDEVVTGFRLHLGGAQSWFGVRADLVTYGKVAGGGMPIGFVAGCRECMDYIDGGAWDFEDASVPLVDQIFSAGTFNKHPFSVAAAWAVLNRLKADDGELHRRLNRRTSELADELNACFAKKGIAMETAHAGSIFSLSASSASTHADFLIYELMARGVYVGGGHACFLSDAHTDEDLDRVITAVSEAAEQMRDAGLVASTTRRIPLSGMQREIWLADRVMGAASSALNLCFVVELRGDLNPRTMADAFRNVLLRHDALRMRFDEIGQFQSSLDWADLHLGMVDLEGLASEQVVSDCVDVIVADAERTPIDLATGPPFRAFLVRRQAQRHVLVFSVHHIAFDGRSYDVFGPEMDASYRSFASGTACELPEASSYATYATEQNLLQAGPGSARAEAFWRNFLENHDLLPRLPADVARAPFGPFVGARAYVEMDPQLCVLLRRLAGQFGVSPFTLLLASFQVLVHRLTESEAFVVGIVALGTHALRHQPMVGLRSQLLPVSARVAPDQTFLSLAAAAKRGILEAQENADYTLGEFTRGGRLTRNPAAVPPLPVVFNFDKSSGPADGRVFGVEAVPMGANRSHVLHDLSFNLIDRGTDIVVQCDYNAGVFRSDTIERWMTEYLNLTARLVASPDVPLRDLVSRERDPSPATASELPHASLVHRDIARQARRNPDRIAVECGVDKLTYRQLAGRARAIAGALRARGVGPEVKVAVWMDRSVDLVASLVGVLQAGGAYVPLDPDQPTARLESMLLESGAQWILTDRSGDLAGFAARGLCLDVRGMARHADESDAPADLLSASNLAYVMFTSGSTGKPKGIQIAHASLSNLLLSMQRCPGFAEDEVLAAVSTFSFDMAVFEIFLPLVTGARLVLLGKDTVYHRSHFAAALVERQATTLYATPSLLRQLAASAVPLPSLRIISGGEALGQDLSVELRAIAKSLYNMYGPTEVTVWCSGARVDEHGPISLGDPVLGTSMFLHDVRWGRPPPTQPGEVVVGGQALARDYLNNPALTAERFVPSDGEPGARLYKTGDGARWLADGRLEYLGRLDRQVKIKGVRVELREVENAIAAVPTVRQCVVLAKTSPDDPNGTKLVAYVVPSPGFSAWDLRKRLRASLPEAMIPTQIVELKSFPLTSNGKTDLAALPDPDPAQATTRHPSMAEPLRTGRETEVALCWREELGIPSIGPDDHFFDLGGNSFQAVQVMERMKQKLGLVVSFQDFLFKTLRQMVTSAGQER
jgi:amino acid adenylation domain-containing protein